jgi:8-oxo-dGTP pyrophosphatase MutT (NUDIX family)
VRPTQDPDPLFAFSSPPRACDAVAALLVIEDGRYVMQLRDSIPGIFYPGHWGCFGGGVEANEAPMDALKRELREELELEFDSATEFTRFDFDFSMLGQRKVYRTYYEVRIPERDLGKLVLHEGVALEAIAGKEIVTQRKVAHYDGFAVWLHMYRNGM